MLSAIVFISTSVVLKMPSEAYPAVYWQYFAVHLIVQADESTEGQQSLPQGAATSLPLKGASWPAPA